LSAKPGLPAASRKLALAQLANSVGDGAFYVTSALFFVRIVGMPVTEVGSGLTIGWAAGFLACVPIGRLADRHGLRRTAVILAIATAVAVGSFVVVRSFPAFVAVACLYGSAQSGLAAIRQALLAVLVGSAERVRVRARLQVAANAGLAAGAALGGLALYFGRPSAYLAIFAVDAAGFLVTAGLLYRLPAVAPAPRVAGPSKWAVFRDRPYAAAAAVNAVMLLYMPMLSLVLPLWIAERTSAPRLVISAVFILNTVGVALFQVRVARRIVDLVGAARAVRLAGVIMLAACGVFAVAASVTAPAGAVAALLAGVGLEVLAEMLLASGTWQISFGLARPDQPGQYQAFFAAGIPVARMIGPVLLTTLIITGGSMGWLALGGLFVVSGAAMPPIVAWAERSRRLPPKASPSAKRLLSTDSAHRAPIPPLAPSAPMEG
jgi:MFS family permease